APFSESRGAPGDLSTPLGGGLESQEGWVMAEYGYFCGEFRYRDADVRRDAAMPSGFAPEEALPLAVRRAERLRGREAGYRVAEALLRHGAPVEVAAFLMAV